MTGTPLSAVDAAWLHMDRATNRMVITAVLLFDDVIAKGELVKLLEERLPRARFRQRIVERSGFRRPRFVDVPVAFHAHVDEVPWPAPGDERALEHLVAEGASAPFPAERPLWNARLVVDEGRTRCAMIFRAHHCLADGLALVRTLLHLIDERDARVPSVGRARPPPSRSPVRLAARAAWHGATMVRLLTLRPDPRLPWKRGLTTSKSMAWTRPIALDDVKRAARARGAHLTDALLACATGALRRAEGRGHRVRALVPTFLKAPGDDDALGNRFGLVYVPLPLDVDDAGARVRLLGERTAKTTRSADAAVALEILGALGRVSRRLEDVGVAIFSSKASAMITSVPGPTAPVHILGRELLDIIAFGPAAGSIGLTAGLFSYRGHIRVAFSVDPALGVDARTLADAFEAEAALVAAISVAAPA